MAIIKPFKGVRPPQDLVEQVASRPYDVLNSEEARAEAEGNEKSLYHIIKPEIDFPVGTDEHDECVYKKAAENFQLFQDKGWLVQDAKENYYIYAQTMNGKTQYGLVVGAYVPDYMNGIIKKHELTRRDKEEDRMKIPCKKLRENAILPTRGTALAAGVDLYALLPDGQESAAVAPQGKYLFPTGIAVEIPEGYVGLVFARSGIATKRQLAPANCVGVIDADYRGELRVFLQNNGTETQTVENGERIAQLVITPCLDIEIEETDELSETLRGASGFGSTGTH